MLLLVEYLGQDGSESRLSCVFVYQEGEAYVLVAEDWTAGENFFQFLKGRFVVRFSCF